jgi:hypothetical protein
MAFQPSISQSNTDIRELSSVDFINGLLRGTRAKTHLTVNDKTADIDGTIDLLDSESRIMGKITVQVKTVGPNDEKKFRYPCPTSLFGYAQRIASEFVLLLAVDHTSKIVLWKYLSQSLIQQNQDKCNQKTITLYFDENERLSCDNITATINFWETIFKKRINSFFIYNKFSEENENLRKQILNLNSPVINLSKNYITQVQVFIDSYNKLLDNEFLFVKKTMFLNCWKRGIGLHAFEENRLEYALYSIKNGESSPLLKQLPDNFFKNNRFDFASMSCCKNEMNENPSKFALNRIRATVNDFIKQKRIIPSNDDFILEYVRDFMHSTINSLRLDRRLLENTDSFMSYIRSKYFINGKPTVVFNSNNQVNIGLLYDCLSYLYDRGYNSVEEVYPARGQYCNSGWVSDWFSSDLAQAKLETVIKKVYKTYNSFIYQNFPLLVNDLDFFKDFDTLVLEMEYTQSEMPIIMYYKLKSNSISNVKSILFSPVNESFIYKENGFKNRSDIFKNPTLKYKGVEYTIKSIGGVDCQAILFNRFNLMETFYKVLNLRIKEYFKRELGD